MVIANNFRTVNIYPSKEELLGARCFFRENVAIGRYDNLEHYLDVQFRLLREDFVANVREAIESYRSNESTKSIKIYENIKIFKDRFKHNECLKITVPNNEDDKQFMNGSLLIFLQRNDLFLAKVIHKLSENNEVVIELVDPSGNIFLNERYTMAECSQYFDPYFHVLNALQNISSSNFPMEKYIVYLDTSSVYMPKYLIQSKMNLDIDGFKFLPEMLPHIRQPLLGLNPPQFEAFKAAITKEFVVIQGPPGTGKTHLGIKIAGTLIKNYQFWYKNSPLLIVSHKNEALDQFLEGLIEITDKLIRVGRQSKSTKLKNYNLVNDESKKRSKDYLKIMQESLVVGMTTSIAARWRDYLEKLKSPIVIVEEAAEVLEAHVIAALTQNCQHLILIGDHQQLQPMTADHTIREQYKLGISLFERMVINKIQHYQLKIQHRMRPEISKLLKIKIYPFLEDHNSVKSRPAILGVDKNVFFFNHQYREETCNRITKKNTFEARFLINFARYLVLNGYTASNIAMLTTYTGQYQEIENCIQNEIFLKNVKISTLDGFQGQECDIVLLSLVRSDSIGFLGKNNRICVALSRARNGFYIFGNMDVLAKNSNLWLNVKKCLEAQKSIGGKLSLVCQNHRKKTNIQTMDDFWKVTNGGCDKKCQVLLSCGHNCCLLCHNECLKHKCQKQCLRSFALSRVPEVSRWESTNGRQIQPSENSLFDVAYNILINIIYRIWNFISDYL